MNQEQPGSNKSAFSRPHGNFIQYTVSREKSVLN